MSHNSETLKKAMVIKMMIIMIAKNMPTILDHHFENQLNAANARAIPSARMKSCTTLIFNGPILNVIPASNPLLIFFGYTTFILTNKKNKLLQVTGYKLNNFDLVPWFLLPNHFQL